MKKVKVLLTGLLIALVVSFSVITVFGSSSVPNASDERGIWPSASFSTIR